MLLRVYQNIFKISPVRRQQESFSSSHESQFIYLCCDNLIAPRKYNHTSAEEFLLHNCVMLLKDGFSARRIHLGNIILLEEGRHETLSSAFRSKSQFSMCSIKNISASPTSRIVPTLLLLLLLCSRNLFYISSFHFFCFVF